MRVKKRSTSFYFSLFVFALIAFAPCNSQAIQTTHSSTHTPLLVPPPPSAPYWTYKTNYYVKAVAVSQDGSTVVAGSRDGNVYVFGRDSSTPLWTYKASSYVDCVAVSANGSTIVAGGTYGENKTSVFGRQSNTTVWTYETDSPVLSVAVSDDGETIALGGMDGVVRVFGRQSNETLWTYGTSGFVYSVAVSANGSTIVAGGLDAYIRVFGRQANATIWRYRTSSAVYSVSVSADGNTIATGGADNTIRVFGGQSNTTLWTYATSDIVLGAAVSRDGTTIATGGYDDHLRVFGRTSNLTHIDHDTGYRIPRAVALSSDGSTIACGNNGTADSRAFLFSQTLGQWSYPLPNNVLGEIVSGSGVGISGDGSLIAYGCDDYKLYVFQYDGTSPTLGIPSVVPSNPVGGQSVNISISATDNVGLSTVTLYYRSATSGPWSSVAMSLSGAEYEVTIGPYVANTNATYYINATDSSGNSAYSPTNAPTGFYTIRIGQTEQAGLPLTTIAIIGGAMVLIIAGTVLWMRRGKGHRK